MRTLNIEWRHYDKEGATCDRCAATGTSVKDVVASLTRELADKGVTVTFTETRLPEKLMAQSNLILFNGAPLETLLQNAAADQSNCPSCACLTGSQTNCRTIEYDGIIYEEVPEYLIRKAAYAALQLENL